MPFSVFTSPAAQWEQMPSFLLGEWLFIALALVALAHAVARGPAERLIWLAALLAGTANDLIFMALPLVDNFWHAQATVMLSPRLPLYIPCLYVAFLYFPAVVVRRFALPPLGAGVLTGLAAAVFYAPFDITGAKLLWWTWHDTDLPVAERLLGAPASSTLWVLTFAGAFGLLAALALRRSPEPKGRAFVLSLLFVAGLTTLLMLVQVSALQPLSGGAPGIVSLAVGLALYATGAVVAMARGRSGARAPKEPWLFAACATHFAAFALIALLFDPGSHRSTGVHQQVGECYVEAQDITGLVRHRYLCANDFDEPFDFACATQPADGARWYTVCGTPHDDRDAFIGGVGALGLLGLLLFAGLSLRPAPAH